MHESRVAVEKSVLVLGATAEAARVANVLSGRGYAVAWAAGTPVNGDAAAARTLLYEGYTLEHLAGQVGRFSARLAGPDGAGARVAAAAVVVATGNRRSFTLERYGLAPSSAVLSVPALRRQLEAPLSAGTACAQRGRRVLVVLDWGADTPKETGTEALALARDVQARWHCEVSVLYRDLQVDTGDLERLTREMREGGVVFCRYDAPRIVVGDGAGGAPAVRAEHADGALEGDLLVLPEDVAPAEDTSALARRLGVRVGADGYFQDVNIRQYRAGLSSRRGILFAGACHMDADAATLLADADRAVADVEALLAAGYLAPEAVTARVDSERCVRCLTCIRTCPHGAVALARYEEVTAALVDDLACYGCGGCVAHCPVRAIELVGAGLPAWAGSVGEGAAG